MLMFYLRAAVAHLRLSKQATLINVAGLTLGIACFIVAYVIAQHLASADGHFARIDRIYTVQQRTVAPGEDAAKPFATSASPALARYLLADVPELEAVARRADGVLRVDAGDRALALNVTFADPALLRIFDFRFVAGDPRAALDEPGSAVITEEMAERLFGARAATGRVLSISRQIGRPVELVVRGVVSRAEEPTTVRFPTERSGILVNIAARRALSPREAAAVDRDDWSNEDLGAAIYVLLPEDGSLSPEALDRRLQALGARIALAGGERISFRARHPSRYFDDQLTSVLGFLGIVSGIPASRLFFLPGLLILAMACFNYVNLTVAVASTRAKEVGLSKVLGASVRQVVQQHLLEGLVAVLAAFGSALVLGAMLVGIINNVFDFEIPFSIVMRPSFWLLAALIVLGTTVAAAGYPAWVMSRFRPLESLRAGSKRSGSSALRSLFIGVQFTVASVLLTTVLAMYAQNAAGRGEIERLSGDPYVQLDNNLLETPEVDPDVVVAALLAAPQIKGVTGMGDGLWAASLDADPYTRARDAGPPVRLRTRRISYDFFATLGVEMLAGRSFERGRDIAAPPDEGRPAMQAGTIGVVLERAAVEALGWPDPARAIGQILYQRTESAAGVEESTLAFEVIGVVDKPPLQAVSGGLVNLYHLDPYDSRLILRLAPNDVPGALAHIAAVWEQLVPQSRLRAVRFADQMLEEALFQMNVMTTTLLSIVAFGFLVALAGIFGMALFVASRRRHEIGIRKSLGADTRAILRQLVVELGRPVVIGNVVAWPLAYSLAQVYSGLFYERAALTPWPFALSLALTAALAWLGVGGQALRAARLQPARVLRHE